MQNYIFWKNPKSAEIFIVILNASILKLSRSVLRFMRISSVSQDISILLYNSSIAVDVCTRGDPFSRADKKWGRATEDKRQLTRTGLLFLPDYIIVHYCPGLHYHPSGSISKKHTRANRGGRGAVNIFLSKTTKKYHWRLVHFKCSHCCTALLRPLLRPCLISSHHF